MCNRVKSILYKLFGLSAYLLVVLFLVYLYLEQSRFWSLIGGWTYQLLKLEVPLILIISLLLYFPTIKNKFIRYVVPAVPVYIAYSLFDIFYSFFGRSPRFSDFQNYIAIFDFSPEMAIGFLAYALLLPCGVFILLFYAYKEQPKSVVRFDAAGRFIVFLALLVAPWTEWANAYFKKTFFYVPWSQERVIRENGRISSFLYYSAKEKENLSVLNKKKPQEIDVYNAIFPGDIVNKKNIHIIVLESFIDPRELKGVVFSSSPLAVELKKHFQSPYDNFSHVLSPVYGTATAQSEFELLTGIEALAKVNSIEFNVLDGGEASSLVNRLKALGYTSIATVATDSGYYNSVQAYRSLGLDVEFMEESDYTPRKGDDLIFDGDVFDYSIAKIKSRIESRDSPIITYVLGMYGHVPYRRNKKIRPDVLSVHHEDDRVQRISNQFYYRTKAIAKYIDSLLAVDPESIIYVTSDHLPPLLGEDIKYNYSRKTNISLLLKNGRQEDVSGMRYYEIPWLIWDVLTQRNIDRDINKEKMESMYYQVLYESRNHDK